MDNHRNPFSSPTAPRLPPPNKHKRNVSRSPTRHGNRGSVTEDIFRDFAPGRILDAFNSPTGRLKASIEAASPIDREFGLRAAVASKNILGWSQELERWEWPDEGGSVGFEVPVAKRRRLSQERVTFGQNQELEYIGSLTAPIFNEYNLRINQIQEELDALNMEEIKRHVLETHFTPSRPSSSSSNVSAARPLNYTKMEDFTAIVTATVLKALPTLGKLMRLMNVWYIRLRILRRVPRLLRQFDEAESALQNGWTTLRPPREAEKAEVKHNLLSRKSFEVRRKVLQDATTTLCREIDNMLDSLDGQEDTLPDAWLDRMDTIETDYANWTVSGDRKVREGEWSEQERLRLEREADNRRISGEAERLRAEQDAEKARVEAPRLEAENNALKAETARLNAEETGRAIEQRHQHSLTVPEEDDETIGVQRAEDVEPSVESAGGVEIIQAEAEHTTLPTTELLPTKEANVYTPLPSPVAGTDKRLLPQSKQDVAPTTTTRESSVDHLTRPSHSSPPLEPVATTKQTSIQSIARNPETTPVDKLAPGADLPAFAHTPEDNTVARAQPFDTEDIRKHDLESAAAVGDQQLTQKPTVSAANATLGLGAIIALGSAAASSAISRFDPETEQSSSRHLVSSTPVTPLKAADIEAATAKASPNIISRGRDTTPQYQDPYTLTQDEPLSNVDQVKATPLENVFTDELNAIGSEGTLSQKSQSPEPSRIEHAVVAPFAEVSTTIDEDDSTAVKRKDEFQRPCPPSAGIQAGLPVLIEEAEGYAKAGRVGPLSVPDSQYRKVDSQENASIASITIESAGESCAQGREREPETRGVADGSIGSEPIIDSLVVNDVEGQSLTSLIHDEAISQPTDTEATPVLSTSLKEATAQLQSNNNELESNSPSLVTSDPTGRFGTSPPGDIVISKHASNNNTHNAAEPRSPHDSDFESAQSKARRAAEAERVEIERVRLLLQTKPQVPSHPHVERYLMGQVQEAPAHSVEDDDLPDLAPFPSVRVPIQESSNDEDECEICPKPFANKSKYISLDGANDFQFSSSADDIEDESLSLSRPTADSVYQTKDSIKPTLSKSTTAQEHEPESDAPSGLLPNLRQQASEESASEASQGVSQSDVNSNVGEAPLQLTPPSRPLHTPTFGPTFEEQPLTQIVASTSANDSDLRPVEQLRPTKSATSIMKFSAETGTFSYIHLPLPNLPPVDTTSGRLSKSLPPTPQETHPGYVTSEPTPEILDAERAHYFRPVISPIKSPRSRMGSNELSESPSLQQVSHSLVDEDSPPSFSNSKHKKINLSTSNGREVSRGTANGNDLASSITVVDGAAESVPVEEIELNGYQVHSLARKTSITQFDSPLQISIAARRRSSASSTTSTIVNTGPKSPRSPGRRPSSPIRPSTPTISENSESFHGDDLSPSIRRHRNGKSHDYTSPDTPPPIPRLMNHSPGSPRALGSFSSMSESSDSPNTSVSGPDSLPSVSAASPRKANTDEQLQQQISTLLESIPARIRLSNTAETASSPMAPLTVKKRRPVAPALRASSSFSNYSRAPTPSFTLAPAHSSTQPRQRAQNGNPEIKVYHLSRSTGEAPIKLFVRLVGENGERVMVRVGGGWADLGEYLKEYASHHGRRAAAGNSDRIEIQDLPPRVVSASAASTVASRNGRLTPASSRPTSALNRPLSSLATRKTRKSMGDTLDLPISNSMSYRSPSTPISSTLSQSFGSSTSSSQQTPPTNSSSSIEKDYERERSSSRLSWIGDESSSLGLAGPKGKRTTISEKDQEWVESMKEKVRLASAEKDREKERERRASAGLPVVGRVREKSLGELDKVGGTKRLFRKS